MQRKNIRILLVGILIIIALAVILIRGDQLVELFQTMQTGSIIPLMLAILFQFGKYISQSFAYAASFRTVGELSLKPRELLPLVFSSYFINVVAPSFNTAGVMLVIDSARKRGVPTGRATSAVLLMQITVITGFIVIMVIGFFILQLARQLSAIYFLLGLVVVFIVGAMVSVIYIGNKTPDALVAFLTPIEKLVNRLSKRFRKGKEIVPWAENMTKSFSEAGGQIRKNPLQATKAFGFSVLASTCELVCFCLVGIAFGLTSPSILIGGYVVATLFSWVAITPQGVGVAEAMIIVALAASGLSTTMATAIAIVYRGVVFWMPFAIGSIVIHSLQRSKTN